MDYIRYPEERSEFEVQAWLFNEIRKMRLDVRGEVVPTKKVRNYGFDCRLDLVIFNPQKEAIRIVEVKKQETGSYAVKKYMFLGVPVDLVWYGTHEKYIEWLRSNANSSLCFGHSEPYKKILVGGDKFCSSCSRKIRGRNPKCNGCYQKLRRSKARQ